MLIHYGLPRNHCETHIPKAPQTSVAPASFPWHSFCYFPAATCRRENVTAFPGLHLPLQAFTKGASTAAIPVSFSAWVTALLPFPPSTTFPKLQQQCSPTGAIWEVDGSKFCTHRRTGAAGFRVRNSHIVHITIYATARRSQSRATDTLQQLRVSTTWKVPSRMGLASTEEAAERQHEILLFTYLSNHLKYWKQLSPGVHCAETAPHSQLSCSCSSHLMEGGDYQEIWHKEWVQMLLSEVFLCLIVSPSFHFLKYLFSWTENWWEWNTKAANEKLLKF